MRMHLGVIIGGHSSDVCIDLEAGHTVAALRQALEEYGAVRISHLYKVGHADPLDEDALVAQAGLVSGDLLSDRRQLEDDAVTGTRLVITQGYGVGRSVLLSATPVTVGREASCDLVVDDPQISREQFSVYLAENGEVVLAPNTSSTNPVRINGLENAQTVTLSERDTIAGGGTSFAIRRREAAPPTKTDRFGATPFNRTPYFRRDLPEQELPVIEVPAAKRKNRFRYLAAISPLFAGIGMALFLDNPRFLLFAALSPIIAIGNWIDQRYLSGKEHREAHERFDVELGERGVQINQAMQNQREARFDLAPDIDELAFRAGSQSEKLWLRDRRAPDFLELRVGIGDVESGLDFSNDRAGEPAHNDRLDEINLAGKVLVDVPVTMPLAEVGALAIVGDDAKASSLAGSLIVQAAALHSPEDLVILGMTEPRRELHKWMKWLPHTRSAASPLGGDHLAVGGDNTASILKALAVVTSERAQALEGRMDVRWPWLLIVLDGELSPDAPLVSQILEAGPAVGISVIWLCRDTASVPRQVKAVAKIQSEPSEPTVLSFVDPGRRDQHLDPERIEFRLANRTARSLAALRDASSANAATALPAMVTLLDVLGRSAIDPDAIARKWQSNVGYSLKAPFAMSSDGPFELDLVADGPHGLIGGTSGSGKSELLQSLLTGLVLENSPRRLNLLFIDYKGGALSKKFDSIPHTVGSVTNLDTLMANRALTSLLAELNYRMKLFDGLDMQKMLRERPDIAPASLVLVVDEFAALVRELPQFVDGVVSIAERGRSLGIHLLLATQRPSGSINDNIQQNTDLRIALRMISSSESSNVIGAQDAAFIPKPLQGRAIAKKAGRLIPIQSAYSEAPFQGDEKPAVMIKPFVVAGESADIMERTLVFTGGAFTEATSNTAPAAHQLERVLRAIAHIGAEPGRSPWQAPLPEQILLSQALSQFDTEGTAEFPAVVGVLDDPERQRQLVCQFDLSDGPLFAFGGAGSGKSTMLETIATAASNRSTAAATPLSIMLFDFASRSLARMKTLPHVDLYVDGDDIEAATRAIALLEHAVAERRSQIGTDAGKGPTFDPVLLVIDGWDNLDETLRPNNVGSHDLHQWFEKLEGLVTRGRQYGIYTVAATSQNVRTRLLSAIPHRLVLRQPGENEYRALGVSSKLSKDLSLRPGQAIDAEGSIIQIAVVDDLVTAADPPAGGAASALSVIAPLPDRVPVRPTAPDEGLAMGLEDLTGQTVTFDPGLRRLLVLGPPRSGKSMVLALLGEQFLARGYDVVVVGSERSPLASEKFNWTASLFGDGKHLGTEGPEMAELSDRSVLLVDDLEDYDGREVYPWFEDLVSKPAVVIGSTAGVRRVSNQNPIFGHLRNGRANLILQSTSREITEALGAKVEIRPGLGLRPGRGVLLVDRIPRVLQCFEAETPIG